MISIEDFKKIELRVGTVIKAERVSGSEKLIKLIVDFGEYTKQAITGLAHMYNPDFFLGNQFVFLVNLKPAKFRGELSECMLLAAVEDEEKEIAPIVPIKKIKNGSRVV